jgi:peptidoglycan/xylan/chitin deacetylase (PgdA/CDA1 family)
MQQRKDAKAISGTQIVITIDDGYSDGYLNVLPILKSKGISAVFFLPTGYIGLGKPIWDWEVAKIILTSTKRPVNLTLNGGLRLARGVAQSDVSFVWRVISELKKQDASRRRLFIDGMYEQYGASPEFDETDRCLDWNEVKEMQAQGMEIGAHGRFHSSLAHMPVEDAIAEIRDCKRTIEDRTNARCGYFSFPFGGASDFNDELVQEVIKAGYDACMLNVHGYNYYDGDAYRFKRIVMTEGSSVAHLLG